MDHNKVMEFLGQFVTDLAATDAAGSVVVGHRLGLYRALSQARQRPSSSPSAPGATRATSPSGCAARPPAGTSATTRRPASSR
jgi:hypothetical protein